MNKLERNFDHTKNKVAGEAKEAAGKITGNERLELKGKIQSARADLKKNVSGGVVNAKESIAGTINKGIDKHERHDKKRNKQD